MAITFPNGQIIARALLRWTQPYTCKVNSKKKQNQVLTFQKRSLQTRALFNTTSIYCCILEGFANHCYIL